MIERFLERLFTWESLENTERGVEFELKNRLDDADFAGIAAVEIDDEEVPPEDVRLETDDGVYGATEITADDPLHFPLAETAQVVLETRRLRLGVHELRVVLRIEGFGEVGFTTEDEITEEDLVDVEPGEYDPEGVRELADEITEPRSIERLLRREENAEDRQEVKRSLRERLDETEEAITDDGNSSRGDGSEPNRGTRSDTYDTFDERVDSLLASLLETRIRARVYAGALSLDGATPEEVSEETGLAPETVESSLEEMELEGIAQSDGEEYDVVPPHQVVRTVSDDLSDFLRSFDLRD